jgi:hypothetical protein
MVLRADRFFITRRFGKEAMPAQPFAVYALLTAPVAPLVSERMISLAGVRITDFTIRH